MRQIKLHEKTKDGEITPGLGIRTVFLKKATLELGLEEKGR